MSTVAEKLRQGREAKNLTIKQIADTTKIRSDHIRALEEGDFNVFSAPVYIRGFIRTYATLLKLDVKQIMSELDGELKQTEKFREPPALTDHPKGALDFATLQLSKVNWRKGLIILGIIAVLVILYLIIVSHRHAAPPPDPLADLKPGMYQPVQGKAGETLPVPQPAQPAQRR